MFLFFACGWLSASAEDAVSSRFCPSLETFRYACLPVLSSDEPRPAIYNPFTELGNLNACELHEWIPNAKRFSYAPLTEYASYVEKLLPQKVALSTIADTLGPLPEPPTLKNYVNYKQYPQCPSLSEDKIFEINRLLATVDLRNMNPKLMELLSTYCIAHEVGVPAWKRLTNAVVSGYVLPIGNLNIAILMHTQHDVKPDAELQEVYYTAVGKCKVTENPLYCVDRFLKNSMARPQYGFKKGLSHTMWGVPEEASYENQFSVQIPDNGLEMTLLINDEGQIGIRMGNESAEGEVLPLGLNQRGQIGVFPLEPSCDGGRFAKMTYVPVAYGQAFKKLQKKIHLVSASDFTLPERSMKNGVEKACRAPLSFGVWGERVAEFARMLAAREVPFDEVYKAIAEQRFKAKLGAEGLPRSNDKAVFGSIRNRAAEVLVPNGSVFETQAIRLVESRVPDASTKRILIYKKAVGSEVWFYRKPIKIWFDERKGLTYRVLVTLPTYWKADYQAQIEKLATLYKSCQDITLIQRELMTTFYHLFNLGVLQQGDDGVNRVFMSVVYQKILQKKLEAERFQNISWDALTLEEDDFLARYLPLLP